MNQFASIGFLPAKFSVSRLDTLRYYATVLENRCGLGPGQERDSSHYVEQTYFLWERQGCAIKLFWSDEAKMDEWLWVTIECKSNGADQVANEIFDPLKPFIAEGKIQSGSNP